MHRNAFPALLKSYVAYLIGSRNDIKSETHSKPQTATQIFAMKNQKYLFQIVEVVVTLVFASSDRLSN